MTTTPSRSAEIRQRLLEAAGEVFAANGFRQATIQDICARAGANIAAVHYHFSSKEQLYLAVLDHAETLSPPGPPPASGDVPAPRRLRAFVEWFFLRLLEEGRGAWIARLLAWEMVEPTPALDEIVRHKIRANHDALASIVRDLLGPGAAPEDVRRCTFSIIGQCVFYRHSQPILTRLHPDLRIDREHAGALADHIVRFSLAGLHGIAAETDPESAS